MGALVPRLIELLRDWFKIITSVRGDYDVFKITLALDAQDEIKIFLLANQDFAVGAAGLVKQAAFFP